MYFPMNFKGFVFFIRVFWLGGCSCSKMIVLSLSSAIIHSERERRNKKKTLRFENIFDWGHRNFATHLLCYWFFFVWKMNDPLGFVIVLNDWKRKNLGHQAKQCHLCPIDPEISKNSSAPYNCSFPKNFIFTHKVGFFYINRKNNSMSRILVRELRKFDEVDFLNERDEQFFVFVEDLTGNI